MKKTGLHALGETPVKAVTTPIGNVSFLDEGGSPIQTAAWAPTSGMKKPFSIMPVDDITYWNSDLSAGVTVTLDNAVLFDGKPTLRIDIPAGTSGTVKVGTTGAAGKGIPRVPYNWDLTKTVMAVRTTNAALIQNGYAVYLGDAGYANFWNYYQNATHYGGSGNTQWLTDNEWWVAKNVPAIQATTGTMTAATIARGKVQFVLSSTTTKPESIWIGLCGILPKRAKPTVILSLDDGYAAWYSYIRPRAKYYDIPVSMAMVTGLMGAAGYLTVAQMQEMFNDSSTLFDFVLHQSDHTDFNTQGLSQYIKNLNIGREQLRAWGITGDGPLHHAWVQSVWGNDGVAALRANGYLSARVAGYTSEYGKDQMLYSGVDKAAYFLNSSGNNLINTTTFATVQSDVSAAISDNSFVMINGHNFGKTETDTYMWTYDKMDQLFDWLASQRDAGTIEIKSWTRWFADTTGRACARR